MGGNFKITGLKELERNTKKAQQDVEKIGKQKQVSFLELFNEEFMDENTDYLTIQNLFDAYNPDLTNEELPKLLESEEWNVFIKEHTAFHNWQSMFSKAGELYYANKLKNVFK